LLGIIIQESIMKVRKAISVALISTGLIASSIGVTHADSTPVPAATNSAAYQAALVKYQADLLQYRITVAKNGIAYRVAMDKYRVDLQAAEDKYYADWKALIGQFQVVQSAYQAKIVPLNATRKAAVEKADADLLAALAVAGATSAQLDLALKAHAAANEAANSAFKAAVAALGAAPVKPTKPAELTKPPAPVRATDPVKPVAPAKPAKPTKSEKPEVKKTP